MSYATDAAALLSASTTLANAVTALESAKQAYDAALEAAIASARTDTTARSVMPNPHEEVARSKGIARGYILAMVNRLFPDAVASAGPGTSPAVADGKVAFALTKGAVGP